MFKHLNSKLTKFTKIKNIHNKNFIYYKTFVEKLEKLITNLESISKIPRETPSRSIKSLDSFKFNQKNSAHCKHYSTNLTKKQRISDKFFPTPNVEHKYLFQETKLNKSLILFYSLIHIPFYLVSFNLAFGLNFLDIDIIRLGLRSITLSQAVVSGINISSIINEIEVQFQNSKRTQSSELDLEEFQKELSKPEKFIVLSFVPVAINFVISQVLVNFTQISTGIMQSLTLGFITSNIMNLAIIFFIVLKRKNFKSFFSSSLFRINMYFAILNICAFILIITYVKNSINKTSRDKGENKNPFLTSNDDNRINNLKTITEYIAEDTKKIEDEISELMDEITPEQIEKMEKIFIEEKEP
jgi:hypothetical protein